MSHAKKAKVPVVRNPLHDHPLMRKGSVHRATRKAIRRKDKVRLKKDWLPLCA